MISCPPIMSSRICSNDMVFKGYLHHKETLRWTFCVSEWTIRDCDRQRRQLSCSYFFPVSFFLNNSSPHFQMDYTRYYRVLGKGLPIDSCNQCLEYNSFQSKIERVGRKNQRSSWVGRKKPQTFTRKKDAVRYQVSATLLITRMLVCIHRYKSEYQLGWKGTFRPTGIGCLCTTQHSVPPSIVVFIMFDRYT